MNLQVHGALMKPFFDLRDSGDYSDHGGSSVGRLRSKSIKTPNGCEATERQLKIFTIFYYTVISHSQLRAQPVQNPSIVELLSKIIKKVVITDIK